MRENHYAISCINLKISHVFNKQDEHNASFFPKYRGQSEEYPMTKLAKQLAIISEMGSLHRGFSLTFL